MKQRQGPKDGAPVTAEVIERTKKFAKDPVAHFNALPPTTTIDDAWATLWGFKKRISLPAGDPGRVNVQKSETDPDILSFAEHGGEDEQYYVSLFRIFRRIGYSTDDTRMVFMKNMILTPGADLGVFVGLIESAKTKVDADTTLPAVTKQGAPVTGVKN